MIGVFDSGIGGLSVVKGIFRYLPQYPIIYFGDTARFPYGIKGPEVIKGYARENVQFLIDKGAKVIVVACNTVSAVALEDLRQEFSIPIFGVIEPAVNCAISLTRNKKVGVIGTRATINSNIYEKKIRGANPQIKVYSQACPLLVSLVEEGWNKQPETKSILAKYLRLFKSKKIDTLVLGCTHYPFIKNLIQKEVGVKVQLIDSGQEVALFLREFLMHNPVLNLAGEGEKPHQFFVSDISGNFQKIAQKWLGKKIILSLKK